MYPSLHLLGHEIMCMCSSQVLPLWVQNTVTQGYFWILYLIFLKIKNLPKSIPQRLAFTQDQTSVLEENVFHYVPLALPKVCFQLAHNPSHTCLEQGTAPDWCHYEGLTELCALANLTMAMWESFFLFLMIYTGMGRVYEFLRLPNSTYYWNLTFF
jgi:hypothetical protein